MADLDGFWWTWEPTWRTFGKFDAVFFDRICFPNSQPKFLVLVSDFFSAKNKASNFPKTRHVGSQVHPRSSKSARIKSDKKACCFLVDSACKGAARSMANHTTPPFQVTTTGSPLEKHVLSPIESGGPICGVLIAPAFK